MFIVDCLPFSKALNKDLLSYFSSSYLEPGSLVKVNIRNKSVRALVIQSKEAREMKSEIRRANFQVKKISSFTSKPFLQKEFLDAVKKTANYFAATEGAVFSQLLPSIILENSNLLTTPKDFAGTNKDPSKKDFDNKKGVVAVVQTENDERFAHYRSLIREEFAKNKSVFFCLPQNEGVLQTKENLERGIESFVCAFYKDMGKSDFKKEWKKACATSHPVVIIGTSRWLFVPRKDFGAIVIEKENESGWKTIARPFIDLRFFAERELRQNSCLKF
jgi:primosomal protein N'